jgi:hypothetical protein
MAEVREQTGEGTLYDTDGGEMAASVAYRIVPRGPQGTDVASWGGELFYPHDDEVVPPGLYVLALEDGTRVDIDLGRAGDDGGGPRRASFRGVGTFGQRTL